MKVTTHNPEGSLPQNVPTLISNFQHPERGSLSALLFISCHPVALRQGSRGSTAEQARRGFSCSHCKGETLQSRSWRLPDSHLTVGARTAPQTESETNGEPHKWRRSRHFGNVKGLIRKEKCVLKQVLFFNASTGTVTYTDKTPVL